ncbi:MAG: hotdog domain-containing protein [Bdellovibrionota bacterium]
MTESANASSSFGSSQDFARVGFKTITNRLIMSGDLNAANTLFGGKLIQWVDEAGAVFVMELLRSHHIVTKKISEVLYNEPTKMGDVLEFLFRVKKVGATSVTVECVVRAKAIDHDDTLRLILNCDLVFVKIDKLGRPVAHHYLQQNLSQE